MPECSCVRKGTADIDILVISRNDDRKIMQSIRVMSSPPLRKRNWNQFSQFRFYQGNTYRKEFKGSSQVETSSTSPEMTTVFHVW